MAGDALTVEEYLAAVAAGLAGPRRWRADVLAELRDGLAEAAEEHRRATGAPGAAAAVAAFGPPAAVVAGFAAVTAAGLARRAAAGLLASGPVAATLWVAAIATGTGWRPLLPAAGVVVVLAATAALAALVVTGRAGQRWGASRPRLAPAAAGFATGACALVDAVVVAAVVASGAAASWPLLAAAGFSALRCPVAGWAATRCVTARARLG